MGMKLGVSQHGRNTGWTGSENRVLRDILEQKRDKVTDKWKRLHNEELIICTPGRGMWCILGRGEAHTGLGKPEAKSPVGKPKHKWEDSIKMALQEVE
jgi:hypothetical protein